MNRRQYKLSLTQIQNGCDIGKKAEIKYLQLKFKFLKYPTPAYPLKKLSNIAKITIY